MSGTCHWVHGFRKVVKRRGRKVRALISGAFEVKGT